MTETFQYADFIHEMIDVRLRGVTASLWFAFGPVFAFVLVTDFGQITTVAVTILSVIGIALFLGAVASRQRVVLKGGTTEIIVERNVLGICWRRQRIGLSEVKKLRLGWSKGEELRGGPPVGFRGRHLPTVFRVRRYLGWLQGEEREHVPAVRLELRHGALVPMATAGTTAEAEALAADLSRRLDCRVVGARLLAPAEVSLEEGAG